MCIHSRRVEARSNVIKLFKILSLIMSRNHFFLQKKKKEKCFDKIEREKISAHQTRPNILVMVKRFVFLFCLNNIRMTVHFYNYSLTNDIGWLAATLNHFHPLLSMSVENVHVFPSLVFVFSMILCQRQNQAKDKPLHFECLLIDSLADFDLDFLQVDHFHIMTDI